VVPIGAVITLATATGVSGESVTSGPYPRDRHELSIGATRQQAESVVVSKAGDLPEVGLELKDFNIDDDDLSWHLEYRWRFRDRWVLSAFTYQYADSGLVTADFDFNFDGVEFEAGVTVDGKLEIDTYVVDVLYAVYQDERAELLVGGGVHALNVETSLVASLITGGVSRSESTSSDTLLAPVPNFRVQGNYAFDERLGVDLTAGWLSASVDEYDGDFLYANMRLRYRFLSRASISIGYQFTRIDISEERGDLGKRALDVDLYGPSLQFSYAF
jgi:hypothetical protein